MAFRVLELSQYRGS